VHFGGFANKYINREFFMDLHPPLARLLVTLSAWIGGFKGNFNFYDIGADYVSAGVPFVTMRMFTGVCGVLVVPIAYIMMRALGISNWTSGAFSLLTLFDNALTTQSRLILLDSYLVLFTALSGLFWVLFQREKNYPFEAKWWTYLSLLGLSLGGAASCKWVGLFVVAVIGLYTVTELWNLYGNTQIPIVKSNPNYILETSSKAFRCEGFVLDWNPFGLLHVYFLGPFRSTE
jgi:dolichyl-phosphate-mannose-protein mannosyltransferase